MFLFLSKKGERASSLPTMHVQNKVKIQELVHFNLQKNPPALQAAKTLSLFSFFLHPEIVWLQTGCPALHSYRT